MAAAFFARMLGRLLLRACWLATAGALVAVAIGTLMSAME
jgi:hypothetical protein